MNRNQTVSSFRTEFFGTTKIDTTETEFFQNTALRPILKFQNELWLQLFQQYIVQNSKDFANKKLDQKTLFVQNSLQKDIKFRSLNIGIVVGLMTTDELQQYFKNQSEYNKRIISMLVERIISQLQML